MPKWAICGSIFVGYFAIGLIVTTLMYVFKIDDLKDEEEFTLSVVLWPIYAVVLLIAMFYLPINVTYRAITNDKPLKPSKKAKEERNGFILSAVKRQVPLSPQKVGMLTDPEDYIWSCPNCHGRVSSKGSMNEHPNYCSYCGQALSWDDITYIPEYVRIGAMTPNEAIQMMLE